MANRGYNRNGNVPADPQGCGGDMDETRVYKNGFIPPNAVTDAYGGSRSGRSPDYGGEAYQEPVCSDDWNYDDGYDGGDYDYEDGEYDYGVYAPPRNRVSMAARASGKTNTEPYGRPPRRSEPVYRGDYRAEYDYGSARPPEYRRRKKRRRGLRRFLIFLLILAALGMAGYFMLFRAPEQTGDGVHTRKPGFYNILIAATDGEDTRTDTIMLATLDGKNGEASLTSIPRDTIVSNGEAVPKINGVYGLHGGGATGAEALLDEVETLLGFRPDGYVIVDYEVFRDAVNALGGVTFDVPMDMTVGDPDTGEAVSVPAGEQTLDGEQALAVCRYRYGYAMADIQRQYVQQNFLRAMVKQCVSPGSWMKLPAVYRAVMNHVITDLSGANVRYLALKALLGGIGDMEQNTLPGEGVSYNGASCYGLFGQSVVDMVNEVMNPYQESLTIDDVYILTVSEGYLVESTWTGTAFDASAYQYD